MSRPPQDHGNIALLLFGLGLSIPIVLFGSGLVVGLLDRFPQATGVGALAIIWMRRISS